MSAAACRQRQRGTPSLRYILLLLLCPASASSLLLETCFYKYANARRLVNRVYEYIDSAMGAGTSSDEGGSGAEDDAAVGFFDVDAPTEATSSTLREEPAVGDGNEGGCTDSGHRNDLSLFPEHLVHALLIEYCRPRDTDSFLMTCKGLSTEAPTVWRLRYEAIKRDEEASGAASGAAAAAAARAAAVVSDSGGSEAESAAAAAAATAAATSTATSNAAAATTSTPETMDHQSHRRLVYERWERRGKKFLGEIGGQGVRVYVLQAKRERTLIARELELTEVYCRRARRCAPPDARGTACTGKMAYIGEFRAKREPTIGTTECITNTRALTGTCIIHAINPRADMLRNSNTSVGSTSPPRCAMCAQASTRSRSDCGSGLAIRGANGSPWSSSACRKTYLLSARQTRDTCSYLAGRGNRL